MSGLRPISVNLDVLAIARKRTFDLKPTKRSFRGGLPLYDLIGIKSWGSTGGVLISSRGWDVRLQDVCRKSWADKFRKVPHVLLRDRFAFLATRFPKPFNNQLA